MVPVGGAVPFGGAVPMNHGAICGPFDGSVPMGNPVAVGSWPFYNHAMY